jgi:hypothetical protein
VIATIKLYGVSFSHAVRRNLWVKGRPTSELTPEEQAAQKEAESTKVLSFRSVSVTENNNDYAQLLFEVLWNQTSSAIQAHVPSLDLECWWEDVCPKFSGFPPLFFNLSRRTELEFSTPSHSPSNMVGSSDIFTEIFMPKIKPIK